MRLVSHMEQRFKQPGSAGWAGSGSRTGANPPTAEGRGSQTRAEPSNPPTAGAVAAKRRSGRPVHRVSLLSGDDVLVSGTRDRKIATIAALQRGRVSRRQLIAAGVSDSVIAGLIRRYTMFRL